MQETITEKLMRAAVEAWGQWPWVPGTVVKEMTGFEYGERSVGHLAVLLGCDWEQAGRFETSLFAVTKAVFARAPRVCDTCAHGFIECGLGHETGGLGCDDWAIASRPWQDVPGARRRWADKGSDPIPIPPMMPVGELLDRARAWLASQPEAKPSLDPDYMVEKVEKARQRLREDSPEEADARRRREAGERPPAEHQVMKYGAGHGPLDPFMRYAVAPDEGW